MGDQRLRYRPNGICFNVRGATVHDMGMIKEGVMYEGKCYMYHLTGRKI